MLKLQKASREGIVSIIVRDKEQVLTKPFLIAFAIALAIHLGLMTLFHVAPFTIGVSHTVFPPTRVEANVGLKESAIADLQPVVPTLRGLPPPPTTSPSLAHEPLFLSYRPMEYHKAEMATQVTFVEIEKNIYEPTFSPLSSPAQEPLRIVVSGVLAEYEMKSMQPQALSAPIHDPLRMVYSVMVKANTGKIFWFETQQESRTAAINQFAEALLRDMTFSIDPKMVVVRGEVELHFHPRVP